VPESAPGAASEEVKGLKRGKEKGKQNSFRCFQGNEKRKTRTFHKFPTPKLTVNCGPSEKGRKTESGRSDAQLTTTTEAFRDGALSHHLKGRYAR